MLTLALICDDFFNVRGIVFDLYGGTLDFTDFFVKLWLQFKTNFIRVLFETNELVKAVFDGNLS